MEVQINYHALSENMEDKVRIIFSFSLYTAPLWGTLVIYLKEDLVNLGGLRPLEGGEVCHC